MMPKMPWILDLHQIRRQSRVRQVQLRRLHQPLMQIIEMGRSKK